MRKYGVLGAVLLVLAASYGFDRLLEAARNTAQARIGVSAFQWLVLAVNLAFAGCIVWLGWLLLGPGRRNLWPAAVCLLAGTLLLLLPAPPFWSLGMSMPGRVLPVLQASPFSFLGKASAFMAVLGLVGLISFMRPRRL